MKALTGYDTILLVNYMHIADGIIPVETCIATDVVALAGVYLGGRNLKSAEIPTMGLFTAALFIISLIHFPLAGTSIHLSLFGLIGILFKKRSIPIIFVVLLFQSLIFQHGGLLVIGLNTLTMSSGALVSWFVWDTFRLDNKIKSVLCGFLGVIIPAVLLSTVFTLANYGKGIIFFFTLYIPAAIFESILILFVYLYFSKVRPEIFQQK